MPSKRNTRHGLVLASRARGHHHCYSYSYGYSSYGYSYPCDYYYRVRCISVWHVHLTLLYLGLLVATVDEVRIGKGLSQLGHGIGTLPIVYHQLRIDKLVDDLSGHHNVLHVIEKAPKVGIKGPILAGSRRLHIRPIMSNIPGSKLSISHIVDGIAIDVEELRGMTGCIDTLVVATIDASLHPKRRLRPPDTRIKRVQPVGADRQTIRLHVKDILGRELQLHLAHDQLLNHQTSALVIRVAGAGEIGMLDLHGLEASEGLTGEIGHGRLQTRLQVGNIRALLRVGRGIQDQMVGSIGMRWSTLPTARRICLPQPQIGLHTGHLARVKGNHNVCQPLSMMVRVIVLTGPIAVALGALIAPWANGCCLWSG